MQICDPQPIKQTLPASFHFLLIFVHFNVNFFLCVFTRVVHDKKQKKVVKENLSGTFRLSKFQTIFDVRGKPSHFGITFIIVKLSSQYLSMSIQVFCEKSPNAA